MRIVTKWDMPSLTVSRWIYVVLYYIRRSIKYTRRSSRRWKKVSHFGTTLTCYRCHRIVQNDLSTAWLIRHKKIVMSRKGAHFVMAAGWLMTISSGITNRPLLFFFLMRNATNSIELHMFFFLEKVAFRDAPFFQKWFFYRESPFIENKYAVRLSEKENIMSIGTAYVWFIRPQMSNYNECDPYTERHM